MAEAGILTGLEILEQCRSGHITILENGSPHLDEARINSNSYDLTLGNRVAVYSDVMELRTCSLLGMRKGVYDRRDLELPEDVRADTVARQGVNLFLDTEQVLDSKKKLNVWEFEIEPEKGWLLKPGIGYLMHTVERISTMNFVPVLDGKSSIGRLFLTVHVTAGYGDTGFDGQYTLEVVAQYPTIVYPGMRFSQMRFHTLVGDVTDYRTRGNYTGEASMGPVPSMAYRQFKPAVSIDTVEEVGGRIVHGTQTFPPGSGRGCHNG